MLNRYQSKWNVQMEKIENEPDNKLFIESTKYSSII